MSRYNTYETARLILRPTNIEDASLILEMLNMPKWLENIGDRNVHSIDDAQAYIEERMLPQLKRLHFGNFTLIRKEDGAKLGTCGLYDREGLEGVDIGFALLPAYEGQGYAYEAASRIKQAGIEDFGISKISGITMQTNTSSQKLLEKLGLKFIKTMFLPDDPEELMLYKWEKENEMGKYSYQYIVVDKDIDELNHVNNLIYVQWMQDAATKHWNVLIEGKNFDKYVWVVKRHEIDYVRSAVLGDELIIYTWVGKTEDYTSIRHVEVQRNGKTIIKAQTVWALLDAETFRPTVISDDILSLLNM